MINRAHGTNVVYRIRSKQPHAYGKNRWEKTELIDSRVAFAFHRFYDDIYRNHYKKLAKNVRSHFFLLSSWLHALITVAVAPKLVFAANILLLNLLFSWYKMSFHWNFLQEKSSRKYNKWRKKNNAAWYAYRNVIHPSYPCFATCWI